MKFSFEAKKRAWVEVTSLNKTFPSLDRRLLATKRSAKNYFLLY